MMLQAPRAPTDYLREANEGTAHHGDDRDTSRAEQRRRDRRDAGHRRTVRRPLRSCDIAQRAARHRTSTAPEVERAIDTICAAAQKAGKIAGIYCRDAVRALAMAKRGFKFIAVSSDLNILRKGAAEILKALKT